jgi:hypothetical protein
MTDNFGRKIFHKQHIESSERLSNGFATYESFKHVYTAERYKEDVEIQLASNMQVSSSSTSSMSDVVFDECLYD